MNNTQKGAWCNLMGTIFGLAIYALLYIRLFVIKTMPTIVDSCWIMGGYFVIAGVTAYLIKKKQSPAEVEADERDKTIQKNAVLISFVFVWILLFLFTLISGLILGFGGTIPVWALAIINVAILIIILGIYSIAVLFQYREKGEK